MAGFKINREYINNIVENLRQKNYLKNEKNLEHNEYIGLLQDIIIETEKKGQPTIIYEYACLLEKENQMYKPMEIFDFAQNSELQSYKQIVKAYLTEIREKCDNMGLTKQIQDKYTEIHNILGNTSSLIDEFTQSYRNIFFVIPRHIEIFVLLGCCSKIKKNTDDKN